MPGRPTQAAPTPSARGEADDPVSPMQRGEHRLTTGDVHAEPGRRVEESCSELDHANLPVARARCFNVPREIGVIAWNRARAHRWVDHELATHLAMPPSIASRVHRDQAGDAAANRLKLPY